MLIKQLHLFVAVRFWLAPAFILLYYLQLKLISAFLSRFAVALHLKNLCVLLLIAVL